MDSYSKLLELVNTSGCFAPANHMYVTELRPDHSAVGVLEVQPSSLNPMGIVHGGALVTLADTVCGTAAFTTGHMCVTLDCSIWPRRPERASPARPRPGSWAKPSWCTRPCSPTTRAGRWPPGFIPFLPRGRQTDPHPRQARRRARLLYFR